MIAIKSIIDYHPVCVIKDWMIVFAYCLEPNCIITCATSIEQNASLTRFNLFFC